MSMSTLFSFAEAVALSQNAEEDLDVVHKGTPMWKVRSFSKWFRRRYYVDSEDAKLKYEPSHKNNCITEPRYIQVGEIVDVRRGWKTDTFNKFGNKVVGAQRKLKLKANKANEDEEDDPALCTVRPLVDEACCFSVVYGDNRCSLDLVASSPQMAATWVRALRHVVTVMRGLNQEKRFIMWLQSQFNEADRDKSGSLHFDECLRLLLQLNVKMSKSEALRIFNLADTNKVESPTDEPSLDAKEFVQFYQLIMRRPEVEEIYHRYARSAREMTAMELQHFLRKEQGMTEASLDDCHSLVDAFEQSELKAAGRISIHGFTHLLRSEQFQIMKAVHHKTVYHDMTQPLSSYYIATSHNTYLLGRQVVAESTMEGYVEALRRGCRCLELDCWDGPEGEPVVTHGYALTSKIVFREVLEDAILPSAFAFSEYPLILSLENHCTSEQQKRLAFHITDVFGDLVYLDSPSEDMETLPSPEQLKRRIIIKGRKAKPVQTADSESEDDDEMDSLSPPNSRLNGNGSSKGYESTSDSEGSTSAYSQRASPTRPRSPAASHQAVEHKSSSGLRKTYPTPTPQQLEKVTDQDLSDLVNICQGVHFHGFDDPDSKCYEMVSLSESKATKLLEKNGEDFIRFNSRRLSRIYPSGTRTGSTNFQPCHFWNSGCQLVALNYQGQRGPVLLNDAKFRDNGACGFILKPDFLRLPDFAKYSYLPTANSVSQLQGLRDRRHLLEIKIISGQHLPKTEGDALSSIVDPYVKVKIVGHPVDTRKKQTHVVSDNGLNPRWDCSFQFVVNLPELAFVIFIVKDETPGRHDPIVGLYALPFHSISPGYRHVPLLDSKHRPMEPASLFIHTKITEVSY